MAGDDDRGQQTYRPSVKTLASFNNYSKWKHKLRENCLKRVREDRTRLLWKFRLTEADDQSANHEDFIKSAVHDIVSDELRKIEGLPLNGGSASMSKTVTDDMIWEYDGLPTSYQGDCEEILLEMQRIFYEELRIEEAQKESESFIRTWEDEEDEYLARAVYEHMQLNSDKNRIYMQITNDLRKQVADKVWCPICKQGELHENGHAIYCSQCKLKLKRGHEVDLNLLRLRLAEAHTEHLDRGCRLRPEFCLETKFELTALYIKCQGCNTLEVII